MHGPDSRQSSPLADGLSAVVAYSQWCAIVAGTLFLTVRHVDGALFQWLSDLRDTTLYRASLAVASSYNPILFVAAAGLAFLFYRLECEDRVRGNQALLVALAGIGATLAVVMLEVLFARRDPSHVGQDSVGQFMFLASDPALQSFPSGIAATSIALAASYGTANPERARDAWALGVMLAVSPVIACVCFLSDALAGAALGFAISDACRRGFRSLGMPLTAPSEGSK